MTEDDLSWTSKDVRFVEYLEFPKQTYALFMYHKKEFGIVGLSAITLGSSASPSNEEMRCFIFGETDGDSQCFLIKSPKRSSRTFRFHHKLLTRTSPLL